MAKYRLPGVVCESKIHCSSCGEEITDDELYGNGGRIKDDIMHLRPAICNKCFKESRKQKIEDHFKIVS
jgi:hypothetical protein